MRGSYPGSVIGVLLREAEQIVYNMVYHDPIFLLWNGPVKGKHALLKRLHLDVKLGDCRYPCMGRDTLRQHEIGRFQHNIFLRTLTSLLSALHGLTHGYLYHIWVAVCQGS